LIRDERFFAARKLISKGANSLHGCCPYSNLFERTNEMQKRTSA
jgi:hypothetical protein